MEKGTGSMVTVLTLRKQAQQEDKYKGLSTTSADFEAVFITK